MSMAADREPGGQGGFRLATGEVRAFEAVFRAARAVAADATLFVDRFGLRVAALDAAHTRVFEARVGADRLDAFEFDGRADGDGEGETVLRVELAPLTRALALVARSERLEVSHREGEAELVLETPDGRSYAVFLASDDGEALRIPDREPEYVAAAGDPAHVASDIRALAERERDRRETRCGDGKRARTEGYAYVDDFVLACRPDALVLSAEDRFSTRVTYRAGASLVVRPTEGAPPLSSGRYPLQPVASFLAVPGLEGPLELAVSQDYPLVVAMRAGGIGSVRFCVAPRAELEGACG